MRFLLLIACRRERTSNWSKMCRKYEIVVQLPSSSAHAGALVVSVDAGSRKIIAMVQRERRIERIPEYARSFQAQNKSNTFSSRGAIMDQQRRQLRYGYSTEYTL